MVITKESPGHQFSARLEQNPNLPCLPPSMLDSSSGLHGLNSGPQGEIGGFSKLIPLYHDISCPTENPYFKSPQFALSNGITVTNKPVGASFAPQKRFLIFDQSGNDTRLFFSPSFTLENRVSPSKAPTFGDDPCEKLTARVGQQLVEEKWGENNLGDESEMLEDSEEIDALLYSDSDDDSDHDDDVTSTGHTPFEIDEKLLDEEVESCDGSPKRQRLLNGNYKKPSFVETSIVKRAISCNYEDDVAHSSYQISYHGDGLDSCKRETKVKIRHALKMLENIVPGLNSNDPLSVIDNAIAYLKSMKNEAESLGLNYNGPDSTTGSSGPGH